MTALAAIVGYLIGSIPSASFLGRLRGVDLHTEGSRNPGTANALRISGPWLAALVLIVEAAKGYGAVRLGFGADDSGAIAAALGAVAGNVYNVWYRFRGGKGLGISLGVLAGAWPAVVVPILVVILVGVLISRSSGIASIIAIAALTVMAFLWSGYQWPTGGVEPNSQLLVLALGIALIIVWKHWRDAPFTALARR
ncbi:MAG TPA: glycerol-3-phosphate acyltransferase [Acidimicrobiia bacterium]